MSDPYDRQARRAQRRYYRSMRRYNRYSNPLGGLAGGLFLLALIFAFAFGHIFGGSGFLVWLFIGLAFASLLGSASSMNPHSTYGGLYGFIWMLGLALCFWIGFWPWILLPVAISAILGSLARPIMGGLANVGFQCNPQMQQQPPYQQPYPPQEQPPQQEQGYEPYQQGYQPAQPQQTYQEGGQQYQPYQVPRQEYEQLQVQYPDQELPPMQQQ